MDDKNRDLAATMARDQLAAALSGVANGDRACLREVFDRSSAKLFGICLRICQERQAAEDVLQEVFVTIWSRAGSFDPARASPITWLSTIARNRAIDWRRSQGRIVAAPVELAEAVADPAPLASDLLCDREDSERLHACLDALEPQTSTAIRAAFLEGATYADLADRAAIPLGTMKSWIRRGLQRLKACLGDE